MPLWIPIRVLTHLVGQIVGLDFSSLMTASMGPGGLGQTSIGTPLFLTTHPALGHTPGDYVVTISEIQPGFLSVTGASVLAMEKHRSLHNTCSAQKQCIITAWLTLLK